MRAFSDVRQVIAISTVGTPLDAAPATPGVARLKQNRPVARSFRLVVHDSVGPRSVTPSFGFIVRLLGYGDLRAKCSHNSVRVFAGQSSVCAATPAAGVPERINPRARRGGGRGARGTTGGGQKFQRMSRN